MYNAVRQDAPYLHKKFPYPGMVRRAYRQRYLHYDLQCTAPAPGMPSTLMPQLNPIS